MCKKKSDFSWVQFVQNYTDDFQQSGENTYENFGHQLENKIC